MKHLSRVAVTVLTLLHGSIGTFIASRVSSFIFARLKLFILALAFRAFRQRASFFDDTTETFHLSLEAVTIFLAKS